MENRRIILLVVRVFVFHGVMRKISSESDGALALGYYEKTCPLAEELARRVVENAVLRDPRMAASLLRLHFHDCFVMGCDASVLLESYGGVVSEKQAAPNVNSLRGFEVVDEIKLILEDACPHTVSCADILAIAARDSVALRGGPTWKVLLGRKDSLKASFDGANKYIPSPNSSLETLIANFEHQGLDMGDLVALSGSHTIGKARCRSFRDRIYEDNDDKYKRRTTFRRILQSICKESGRDDKLVPLDYLTPARFDKNYYNNILQGRGLLPSDNVLATRDHEGELISKLVWAYASDQQLFFDSFVNSIVKMGSINVLTAHKGQIRNHCRFVNG